MKKDFVLECEEHRRIKAEHELQERIDILRLFKGNGDNVK
jgi:hypothetical protein